ncbi:MAG: hypothetical protein LIO62_07365 [Clostridiales bacterium]|nr:hypothetical protein [Clostridiales bacterium]
MSSEKDDILKILEDFNKDKELKNSGEPLPPSPKKPLEKIDFARESSFDENQNENTLDEPQENKESKTKKIKIKINNILSNAKNKIKQTLKNIDFKKIFTKKFFIALGAVIVVIAVVLGTVFGVQKSQEAYLEPYKEKYPDAEFSVGMMEKYCDILGENPTASGYLEIGDLDLKTAVFSNKSDDNVYLQKSTSGAETFNRVIYLQNDDLEEYYKDAESYNDSQKYVLYSDFYDEYTYKIVGAYYTNTNADDDNGYIFPYSVTEVMTTDSFSDYFDRLQSRFLYDTGITLTRNDELITFVCETDFHDDFKFVVVGVLRDDTDDLPTASDKDNVHYPQVIYDEQNEDNPYKFSSNWYPEIIVTSDTGETETVQKSISDYK